MYGPPDSWILRGPAETCEYHEDYERPCERCEQERWDYEADRYDDD